MEMSAGQLVTRLMCTEGQWTRGCRTGKLNQDTDIPRLVDAAQELHQMPITSMIHLAHDQSVEFEIKATQGCKSDLGLIVVDYIGLMGDSRMSRQEQVSEASRGLKGLAKELDVCVMALSQLNRSVESNG